MHRLTASALLATPRVTGGGRRLLRSGTIAAVTHASQQQIGPRRWRWAAGVVAVGSAALSTASVCSTEPAAAVKDSRDDGSPRLDFWNEGWAEGRTGFHRADVNLALLKHLNRLDPGITVAGSGLRVLVTLCGKTVDLPYLASLPGVASCVGIDGVVQAAEEFSAEQPDSAMKWSADASSDTFRTMRSADGKLDFMVGDFFALDPGNAKGQFDCVFDRASLVAIRPSDREAYVRTVHRNLKKGGKILLVCLERRAATNPEVLKSGPPYSIDEAEVRRLYDPAEFDIELLDDIRLDTDGEYIRYKKRGITEMRQLEILITKK